MTAVHDEQREAWLRGDSSLDGRAVTDSSLAEELYADLDLDLALQDAASTKTVRRPRRMWRVAAFAAPLAAAAVLLLIFGPLHWKDSQSPQLRGEAAGPALVSPSGTVSSFPRRFLWRSAEGTSTYRFELYDAGAHRRAVAVVSDTTLVRASAPDDSVGAWRWLVVELRADGSEGATSKALEFEVEAP